MKGKIIYLVQMDKETYNDASVVKKVKVISATFNWGPTYSIDDDDIAGVSSEP